MATHITIDKGLDDWEVTAKLINYIRHTSIDGKFKDDTRIWHSKDDKRKGKMPKQWAQTWPGLHGFSKDRMKRMIDVVEHARRNLSTYFTNFDNDTMNAVTDIWANIDHPMGHNVLDAHEKYGLEYKGKPMKYWYWRFVMTMEEVWHRIHKSGTLKQTPKPTPKKVIKPKVQYSTFTNLFEPTQGEAND